MTEARTHITPHGHRWFADAAGSLARRPKRPITSATGSSAKPSPTGPGYAA
jgi:hypothetical protein